jgi:hypothetical protein
MKTVTIPVVKGDDRPVIRLRIDDANKNAPIEDLANNTVTAGMKFRESGSETTLADISLTKIGDGYDALVQLSFAKDGGGSWLDGCTAGLVYEGQVYLDFDGARQTVQTKLRFLVKEAFAEA